MFRSGSGCLLGLAVACAVAAEGPPAAELNDRSDGGASTVAEPAGLAAPAVPAAGLMVEAGIHAVGGGFRGFSVLAAYPGRPAVTAVRSTRRPDREPYRPVTLVRVVDPDGAAVGVEELTEQDEGSRSTTLPAGAAAAREGIWRVDVFGGRQGDRIALALPAATTWGVRGAPSLHISEAVPADAWLWIPPGATRVQIEQFGGPAGAIAVRDSAGAVLAASARREGFGKRLTALIAERPADGLLRLDLARARGLALLVEGAPGLLCPSREAALALHGGMEEAAGSWRASPLVARLARWSAAVRPADIAVKRFDLPAQAPALARPQDDVLLFGKYGLLTGIQVLLARTADAPVPTGRPMTAYGMPFAPLALANVAAFASPLNPLHRDPAVVRRAALEAFRFAATNLDGGDLLRENDLFSGDIVYPVTHAFFLYGGAIGGPLPIIADQLDPATRRLWRDLAVAMGDRQADFQGYESNQWLHNLHGHLAVFRATGERRFLGYFERAMRACLAGAFGRDAKFGQHPAGYFLEEYGCDGNYDNMNLTALALQWREYRALPEADPRLAADMLAACERDLAFKSLFWLTDWQGREAGPTAHCSRRPDSTLIANNPAGDYLLRDVSALARARCETLLAPAEALRLSAVMPYRAVTDELARTRIAEALAGRTWAAGEEYNGGTVFSHPVRAPHPPAAAVLPIRAERGLWELPGIVAWKRGGLYAVVFHDVDGLAPERRIRAVMGGGPTALWSAPTGAALLSQSPPGKHYAAERPEQVVFSGVYGTAPDGAFVHSGKARSHLRWLEPGRRFAVTERLPGEAGELTWTYELDDAGLAIEVSLRGGLREAWVNLPLTGGGEGAGPALAGDGTVRWSAPGGAIAIRCPGAAPVLTGPLDRGMRCLRLAIAGDGTPVRLQVALEPSRSAQESR